MPVVTWLTPQYRGLGGKYSFLWEGERVDGVLEHIGVVSATGSYLMTFEDKYTRGQLTIEFDASTSLFDGLWTLAPELVPSTSQTMQSWTGKRSQRPLKDAECDVPLG